MKSFLRVLSKPIVIITVLIGLLTIDRPTYGHNVISDGDDDGGIVPTFDKAVENITVKIGQEAVLPCFVNNIGSSRVIWSKSGDILALGATKISSDTRLNIQHRYVSEWHLIIDDVVSDDEGQYICKTSGNYFKTIHLQVLIPPSLDELVSTPAGTIIIKEDSSITLKCYAEGIPVPIVKWYRWKQFKKTNTDKEELMEFGNELFIPAVKRNDAYMYECVAKNSVPPATSRVFNIEVQSIPSIQLNTKNIFQFLNNKVILDCVITGKPLDKLYWSKNGLNLNQNYKNYKIDRYDVSNPNNQNKIRFALEIINLKQRDLGEYQCCAENQFGTICSSLFVNEIKLETNRPKSPSSQGLVKKLTATTTTTTTTTSDINRAQENNLIANILYDDDNDNVFETFDYKRKSSFFNEIKHDKDLNDPARDREPNSITILKASDFFHVDRPYVQKSSSTSVINGFLNSKQNSMLANINLFLIIIVHALVL